MVMMRWKLIFEGNSLKKELSYGVFLGGERKLQYFYLRLLFFVLRIIERNIVTI